MFSFVKAEHILRIGLSYEAEPIHILKKELESLLKRSTSVKRPTPVAPHGYDHLVLESIPNTDDYVFSFEEIRARDYFTNNKPLPYFSAKEIQETPIQPVTNEGCCQPSDRPKMDRIYQIHNKEDQLHNNLVDLLACERKAQNEEAATNTNLNMDFVQTEIANSNTQQLVDKKSILKEFTNVDENVSPFIGENRNNVPSHLSKKARISCVDFLSRGDFNNMAIKENETLLPNPNLSLTFYHTEGSIVSEPAITSSIEHNQNNNITATMNYLLSNIDETRILKNDLEPKNHPLEADKNQNVDFPIQKNICIAKENGKKKPSTFIGLYPSNDIGSESKDDFLLNNSQTSFILVKPLDPMKFEDVTQLTLESDINDNSTLTSFSPFTSLTEIESGLNINSISHPISEDIFKTENVNDACKVLLETINECDVLTTNIDNNDFKSTYTRETNNFEALMKSNLRMLLSIDSFIILGGKNSDFEGSPLTRLHLFMEFCAQISSAATTRGRKSVLPRKSFSSKASDFSKLSTDIYPFTLFGQKYRFVQVLPDSTTYLIQEFSSDKEELLFFILRVSTKSSIIIEENVCAQLNPSLYSFQYLVDHDTENTFEHGHLCFIMSPFLSQHTVKDVIEVSNIISSSPEEIVVILLLRSLLKIIVDLHSKEIAHCSLKPEDVLFILPDDDGNDRENEETESAPFFSLAFSDFSNAILINDDLNRDASVFEQEKNNFLKLLTYLLQTDILFIKTDLIYSKQLWLPLISDLGLVSSNALFGVEIGNKYIPLIDTIVAEYKGFLSPLARLKRITILLYEL